MSETEEDQQLQQALADIMLLSPEERRQAILKIAREVLYEHAELECNNMSRQCWEETVADWEEGKLIGPRAVEAIGAMVFVGNKKRFRPKKK